GSAVGADEARGSYRGTQRQYDGAYYQCMYAAGHKVPVYGNYAQPARTARAVPQRTPRGSVPPPPDAPPPRIEPPANLPPEHIPPPDAPPPK
ncbi:MAG TPA: hypothetical protein VFR86_03140, partial [Burkholderiaceae bacterium]|nr:hypothetical protein [Burkholderiaceae bacterium]